MEYPKPPLPDVADRERSPLVDVLLEMIPWHQRQIEELEQQILKLKGETTKPRIKSSTMDKERDTDENKDKKDDSEPRRTAPRNPCASPTASDDHQQERPTGSIRSVRAALLGLAVPYLARLSQDTRDLQAGPLGPLAPARVQALVALSVAPREAWAAKDRSRTPGPDSTYVARQSAVGRPQGSV